MLLFHLKSKEEKEGERNSESESLLQRAFFIRSKSSPRGGERKEKEKERIEKEERKKEKGKYESERRKRKE